MLSARTVDEAPLPAREHVPHRRRLRLGIGACVAGAIVLATACSEGDDDTREVLVDYVHDEVASSFLYYFPADVTVHPGDTVRFRQQWTGEPHSVTMGTLVDEMVGGFRPLYERWKDTPFPDIPPEVIEQADELEGRLPFMLPDDFNGGPVNQNVAQPCFLDAGEPPEDPMTPCAPEDQEQPVFNGRQTYYNSGFIDYRGDGGNVFEVELAEDIAPGTYFYYCNFHGIIQNGSITVAPADEEIPSPDDVARQAVAEIDAVAQPLLDALATAEQAEDVAEVFGMTLRKPFAGWGTDDETVHAIISQFIPAQMRITVGETVTWSFVGGHTVSFNPPDYFSELTIQDDGTVIFSPDALEPRGGPGFEPSPDGEDGEGPPSDGDTEGGPPGSDARPEPPAVDVGPWDGKGFLSSGMTGEGTYSITFTEPGTYRYACLVHPQMVGTVVVEEG